MTLFGIGLILGVFTYLSLLGLKLALDRRRQRKVDARAARVALLKQLDRMEP